LWRDAHRHLLNAQHQQASSRWRQRRDYFCGHVLRPIAEEFEHPVVYEAVAQGVRLFRENGLGG